MTVMRESFAERVQRKILGQRRDGTDPHALHKRQPPPLSDTAARTVT